MSHEAEAEVYWVILNLAQIYLQLPKIGHMLIHTPRQRKRKKDNASSTSLSAAITRNL